MVRFAFFKEIFFAIGDFFTWGFQVLPTIGYVFNWILSFVVFGLLVYWCIRTIGFGTSDRRHVDYRKPHNFID